ncbi:coiled-coil protein [Mycena olivaceomarginata]|nr:coiled-coil protein [Mycena olivaceomarginata]
MASSSDGLDSMITTPFSSAGDMRYHLQSLLDAKERQLQQAGALGQRVLAQQMELEERIRQLQEIDADSPDDDPVDEDARERYRELAETLMAWNSENADLSSGFGARRPPSPPPASSLSPPEQSTSARTPVASTSTAVGQSRRARNAAHRADDVEFAFEIGSGLLTEVRRLQALLAERDKAIQDNKEEKDDLDKTVDALRAALRQQEASADKYKEENWNLEVTLQDLRTQLAGSLATTASLTTKSDRLTAQLAAALQAAESAKHENERLSAVAEETKAKYEADVAGHRKAAAGLVREKGDLQGVVDRLTKEAQRAGRRGMLGGVFGSPVTPNGAEGDGLLTPAHGEENDVFGTGVQSTRARRTAYDDLEGDELLDSPDASPIPGRAEASELEVLRQKLAHAQRQISTLKGTLRREKEGQRRGSPMPPSASAEFPADEDEEEADETVAQQEKSARLRQLTPFKVGGRGRGARGRGARGMSLVQRLGMAAASPAGSTSSRFAVDKDAPPVPAMRLTDMDTMDPEESAFFQGGPGDISQYSDDLPAEDEPYAEEAEAEEEEEDARDRRLSRGPQPLPDAHAVDLLAPAAVLRLPRRAAEEGPRARWARRGAHINGGDRPSSVVGAAGILAAELGEFAEEEDEGVERTEAAMQTEEQEKEVVERIVERIVEVPIERVVEVEKIVERVVEVPVEKIVEVEKIVDRIVEVPVEKIVEVDRIVEKLVEVPVDRIVEVEKLVEKLVEVPVERIVEVEKIVERIVEVEVQRARDQGDVGMQTDPSSSPTRERRTTLVPGRSPTVTPRKSGAFLAATGGDETETETETETDMEDYEDARGSLRLGSRDDLGSVRTADFGSAREGGFASSRDNFASSQDDFQRRERRGGGRGGERQGVGDAAAVVVLRAEPPLRGRMWSRAWILPPLWSRAPRHLRSPVVAPEPEPLPPKPEVKEMSVQTDEWTPPPAPVAAVVRPSTPAKTVQTAVQDGPWICSCVPSVAVPCRCGGAASSNSSLWHPLWQLPPPQQASQSATTSRDSGAMFGNTVAVRATRSSIDDRRQSIDSAISSVHDFEPRARVPSNEPLAVVDKSRPPMMALPPPPRAPPPPGSMPPPNFIPDRPPRPSSPPPAELIQRATTPTYGSMLMLPGSAGKSTYIRQHGSSMPPSAQSLRQPPSTSSFRSAANAAQYAQNVANAALSPNRKEQSTVSLVSERSRPSPRSSMSSDHNPFVLSRSQVMQQHAQARTPLTPNNRAANTTAEADRTIGPNASTDPTIIHAITQTMIGEFLYKYTRKAIGKGYGERRHKRFFWVHPYTQDTVLELGGSGVVESYIDGVRSVLDPNPMPPGLYQYSVVVSTPQREMKITAPTKERHDIWLNVSFEIPLARPSGPGITSPGSALQVPPSPMSDFTDDEGRPVNANTSPQSQRSARSVQRGDTWNTTPRGQRSRSQLSVGGSLGKRSGTPAIEYLRWNAPESPYSPTKSFVDVPGHDEDDLDFELHDPTMEENGFEGLENVRACCDGKHTVGHHHHHHPVENVPEHDGMPGRPVSPSAWSFRSRAGSTNSRDGGNSIFTWGRAEGAKMRFGSRRSTKTPVP